MSETIPRDPSRAGAAPAIRRLAYSDLPAVIAIERRSFPAPWSLAMAQYDPGATLDLGMGYGQNALSQSAMRSAAKDLPEPHPGKDDDYASSGKSRDEHLAALRREYARRVAADGVASANAWATEMGRRDARAERD